MDALPKSATYSRGDEPSARGWSGLSTGSKRLIAFGVLLLLLMVTAVGATVIDMRRAALNETRQELGKLGIAIAEQTTRSVQAVDLTLTDMRRDLAAQSITTPEAFRAALQTKAVQDQLRQREETLPQADAFIAIGADGFLINTSRIWPAPVTDLSNRDYVRYFRDHTEDSVVISEPVRSRTTGDWSIFIARRVNGPSGQFLGLLLGSLDLSYFRDFFRAVTANAGTSASLLTRSGFVLASFPATVSVGDRVAAASEWYPIVAGNRAHAFESDRWIEPGRRVVSVHPLADYPFVVTLSLTMADALARWNRAALLAGTGTGCAVLCVLLLLRALGVQLRRLELSERSLEQSRQRLAQDSAAFLTTLDHMNQGIMMIAADQTVAVCNRAALAMLDLPEEFMAQHPKFAEVVAYQSAKGEFPAAETPSWLGHADLLGNPLSYERRRPNGRILEIQSVRLTDGGVVRSYTDITDRRHSEEQVRFFAHHDDLTKLSNRVVFQQRLADAIGQADAERRSVAVLYLDLDRFKLVNDTRGHAAGDALLKQVAARLRTAVREQDTIARMGGDEFAIIQPSIDQPHASARLAERISEVISRPYDIEGWHCSIGVSIGIARYPEHASSASDLVSAADTALYRAKADGRGVFRVFAPEMNSDEQRGLLLEQELQDALERQQFELVFQPIVAAGTGRIVCCEALVRWRHPMKGLIGPAEIAKLAENCGLIRPIGRWVLQAACTAAASWPDDVAVAVNVSPAQLGDGGLAQDLDALAGRTGLALGRLVLEIPESVLLEESETNISVMRGLRQRGVRFSLDDFGTAHAALSHLHRFPFDTIKVGRGFIQDLAQDKSAQAIVTALLGMASALGMAVVADGVDTEAQLAVLTALQCAYVQGFLTGAPLAADALVDMLARNGAPNAATFVRGHVT